MVSIVVPAFNEAATLGRVLDGIASTLAREGIEHELIAVDDASTDETPRILAARPALRVLRHAENRGYGASLKTGIEAARGDIIGILDADGTYPPEAFPRLLAALTGERAMVVGVRSGSGARAFPLLRRPGKEIVAALAAFLVGQRIPDLNSGMRVMRRDFLAGSARLLPDGFSFTTTVTLAALTNRLGVAWVPITYMPRVSKSTLTFTRGLFREFPTFVALVVRIVTYFRPLRFFGSLGLFFLALGALNLIRTLTLERNVSDASILLIVVGIQIGLMGLLADLIVRSRLP